MQRLAPIIALLAAALPHDSACARGAKSGPRANIVLFLSDDHGQEFAGCYGNAAIRTPHLDDLAGQGMRLTRVLAASPTCTPSRSSIFTGLYPPRHGAMGNHTDCRPDVRALPAYLKALGYRVVLANKADVRPASVFDFEHLRAALPVNPKQLRKYRGEGLDTKAVERFLADHVANRGGQPLCLILGDNCPHVIWEHNKLYDRARLPIPPYLVDTPATRTALANYYQDITTMDRHVGEVLAALDRHALAQNTLFIYTSDQGPEWPKCKWTLYDTGLLVPFLARWPGKIKPGAVSDAMVSLVDLTPTLVDVAGASAPERLDGRSFREVLLGTARTFRQEVFAAHTGDGQMNRFPQRAVRDARYKYILNLHPERRWTTHFTLVPGIPNSHKEVWDTWVEKAARDPAAARLVRLIEQHPAEELYDTCADPCELENLAARPEFRPVLARMRTRLAQWRADVDDRDDSDERSPP